MWPGEPWILQVAHLRAVPRRKACAWWSAELPRPGLHGFRIGKKQAMSANETRTQVASDLMLSFAKRTGVSSDRPPQRYLWTDAFAVCNLLGLARTTGDGRYAELALRLIRQVHEVLGRHHPDNARADWLSGLADAAAAAHPTRGGLRIGKKLPERRPGEPFDERLEWDRDGQYFHYLTKWMHALDQTSRATRQPLFNLWARELAEVAHRAFCHGPAGSRRMVWKMSVDLSRPLVPSMGQHDALDGLITCAQLEATAADLGCTSGPDMTGLVADFASMTMRQGLSTVDPLGLGGLLTDAYRVAQIVPRGGLADGGLLDILLASALDGLSHYGRQADLEQPASGRLAFRELGLAIGLRAITLARDLVGGGKGEPTRTRTRALLAGFTPYLALGASIESFWLDPGQHQARTWQEHRDIDEVMLATALAPEGFVTLTPVA